MTEAAKNYFIAFYLSNRIFIAKYTEATFSLSHSTPHL